MKRQVELLAGRTFDVLVVGGGVYGLTIAYDAAQRGLSVALIERNDFGSGASFNHLRTIHGGLRYLQSLDLVRARESIGERRTLARIAPHLVRPLSFVLPLSRSLTRGAMAMRAGFALDRLVACDRNTGVPAGHRLEGGRVVSRQEAIARWPLLAGAGPSSGLGGTLTGAAVWQDYVTVEADRLTFAFAAAADAHGALLANHVEAVAPLMDGSRVVGVRAVDRQRACELEISARLTVNATGAALDGLRRTPGSGSASPSAPVPLMKAMNLVTRRDGGDAAIGGRSASGRNLFMVPWRGRALFGTWESPRTCGSGDASATEAEVAAFLLELNEAFPSLALTLGDVSLVHRGVVPAVVHANGRIALEGHDVVRDDDNGLISVAGTKYTTARAVAERIVDTALKKLNREAVPSRTAKTPLPGGDPRTASGADGGLPDEVLQHLMAAYGSRYPDVAALASSRAEWRDRLTDDSPVVGGQLVWAVRSEMAVTLADAVLRRTPLGSLGHPGDSAISRAAAIVGAEAGWSAERTRDEVEAVDQFFRWRG